jgi:2-polyprenyl-6-methoxyphenol hydroxylase-like FAD-dependent oxidoreductase
MTLVVSGMGIAISVTGRTARAGAVFPLRGRLRDSIGPPDTGGYRPRMALAPVTETDVLVIGGGPVGAALTIDLMQRGVRCRLIERHPEPQPIPKGQNLTQRTMEYLALLGVEDAVRESRTLRSSEAAGGMTIYGTFLGDYGHDWLLRSSVSSFYHRTSERLPQPVTERALRRRLADLQADVAYGWTAESLEAGDDDVAVRSRTSTGETTVTRARFVVGCDGSSSMTRTAAGIGQRRVDHDRKMALIIFRSPEMDELATRYAHRQFFTILHPRLDGYWQFLGRVDDQSRWFFHAPVPVDSTVSGLDVDALVAAAVGRSVALQAEHVGFWDLRFAIADEYRAGRVFIAGDAAHSHPPYGGYGINSGLEDAGNLAWKLALALRTGDERILDSYDEERRPVFESTAVDFIDRSIRQDREFLRRYADAERASFEAEWQRRADLAAADVGRFAPHYGASPIVIDGDGSTSAVGDHRVQARAGYHLAPWRAGDATMLSLLGKEFTLLTDEPARASALAEESGSIGVPLEVVAIGPEAVDAYGTHEVLVRPDLYVAWVSSGEERLSLDVLGAVTAQPVAASR